MVVSPVRFTLATPPHPRLDPLAPKNSVVGSNGTRTRVVEAQEVVMDTRQNQIPCFEDSLESRVRRVLKLATRGRSPSTKIIQGAINNVYETTARDLLESTLEKTHELNLTAEEQEQQVSMYLRLLACQAVLNTKVGTPGRTQILT